MTDLRVPSEFSAYRREGGAWLIEVRLRDVRQLFHNLDPAPFREKDLDPDAETYIVDAVRELGHTQSCKLLVYLPQSQCGTEDAQSLPGAVRHYFEYRARHAREERHRLLGRGVGNLVIGLVFMSGCLWLRRLAMTLIGQEALAEGLLLVGWVAMWRPIEIFLYDWWPLLKQQRRFEAIGRMPVEVRAG